MLSAHTRHESMVMDMDVFAEGNSEPVTRATSPLQITTVVEDDKKGANADGDVKAQPAANVVEPSSPPPPKKMGNLMKELKQDVQQGAMEFDMSSFF